MIEAIKQALEALQKIYIAPEHEEYIRVWWPACEDAITSLRQAISEAEKQSQEPVAWMFEFPDRLVAPKFDSAPRAHGGNWKPLYSHPQPKREWQGLTDEDMEELSSAWWKPNENEMALIDWVEAKLKEKNT